MLNSEVTIYEGGSANVPPRNVLASVNNDNEVWNIVGPMRRQVAVLSAAGVFAITTSMGATATTISPDESVTNEFIDTSLSNPKRVREEQITTLLEEVQGLSRLEDGWDGIGSIQPAQLAIEDALAFVGLLPPEAKYPEVTVAADGEAGFFWKTEDSYIDVGFKGNGKIYYYARSNGESARGIKDFDRKSLPEDLLSVIARV